MISEILPNNQDAAMTAEDISKRTGLSKRDVRREIRNERRAGMMILADTCDDRHGYWLWDKQNIHELRRYVGRVEGAILDMFNTLEPFKQELAQYDNNKGE